MRTKMPTAKWLLFCAFLLLCIITVSRISGAPVAGKEAVPISRKTAQTPEAPPVPIEIICQPQNRVFVPGYCVTLSLQASGRGLQYQWYCKKPGQKKFRAWSGHTHASETVAPTGEWDGMRLYCDITDADGNSLQSDVVTVSRGDTPTVLGVGDSICSGRRNGSKGFVGDLGLPYLNAGVSGSALSTVRDDIISIPDKLMQVEDIQPDIVIAEGGLNDLYRNVPLGEIPKKTADSADSLDISTIMGGLQKLFLVMREKYPYAQHYFLIPHKICKYGSYLVTQPNGAGYTEQDMHDAFVACCRVYDIGVIDVFEESGLDTSDPSVLCAYDYKRGNDPDWERARSNDDDYVNGDGVHPLNRGYIEFYVPVILKACSESIRTSGDSGQALYHFS